jgi:hypothetical protein
MATLNLITFPGGFSIAGTKKSYVFQNYYFNEEESSIENQALNTDSAFVGTDKGIIFLDTTCTINNTGYNDITAFLSILYRSKVII